MTSYVSVSPSQQQWESICIDNESNADQSGGGGGEVDTTTATNTTTTTTTANADCGGVSSTGDEGRGEACINGTTSSTARKSVATLATTVTIVSDIARMAAEIAADRLRFLQKQSDPRCGAEVIPASGLSVSNLRALLAAEEAALRNDASDRRKRLEDLQKQRDAEEEAAIMRAIAGQGDDSSTFQTGMVVASAPPESGAETRRSASEPSAFLRYHPEAEASVSRVGGGGAPASTGIGAAEAAFMAQSRFRFSLRNTAADVPTTDRNPSTEAGTSALPPCDEDADAGLRCRPLPEPVATAHYPTIHEGRMRIRPAVLAAPASIVEAPSAADHARAVVLSSTGSELVQSIRSRTSFAGATPSLEQSGSQRLPSIPASPNTTSTHSHGRPSVTSAGSGGGAHSAAAIQRHLDSVSGRGDSLRRRSTAVLASMSQGAFMPPRRGSGASVRIVPPGEEGADTRASSSAGGSRAESPTPGSASPSAVVTAAATATVVSGIGAASCHKHTVAAKRNFSIVHRRFGAEGDEANDVDRRDREDGKEHLDHEHGGDGATGATQLPQYHDMDDDAFVERVDLQWQRRTLGLKRTHEAIRSHRRAAEVDTEGAVFDLSSDDSDGYDEDYDLEWRDETQAVYSACRALECYPEKESSSITVLAMIEDSIRRHVEATNAALHAQWSAARDQGIEVADGGTTAGRRKENTSSTFGDGPQGDEHDSMFTLAEQEMIWNAIRLALRRCDPLHEKHWLSSASRVAETLSFDDRPTVANVCHLLDRFLALQHRLNEERTTSIRRRDEARTRRYSDDANDRRLITTSAATSPAHHVPAMAGTFRNAKQNPLLETTGSGAGRGSHVDDFNADSLRAPTESLPNLSFASTASTAQTGPPGANLSTSGAMAGSITLGLRSHDPAAMPLPRSRRREPLPPLFPETFIIAPHRCAKIGRWLRRIVYVGRKRALILQEFGVSEPTWAQLGVAVQGCGRPQRIPTLTLQDVVEADTGYFSAY